ncbi:T9SS type A sorting domain-containing protein [Roseivirga misakiensis]|uniref:Secretion system C-terminal sorting domain-containing protein n=1 Tax=Roseivirga misakiensis TaxID=1563681 RepID=A0A1E5T2X7_9BACT|nr:T9SS type A sorting domain-containing protein [Roseivirga misakiensis]OEK05722.1 hypothetical protein BFP71_06255 [Roseivirga misakiensis]
MKAKIRIPIVGALLILCACFFIFSGNTVDEREAYEAFLKKEYAKFNTSHPTTEDEEERPDQPDHAYFLNHIQTLDPAIGHVPLDGLNEAAEEVLSIRRSANLGMSISETNSDLEWNNIPADIAGRVRGIVIDPVRPTINDRETTRLWAGSVTGGLWVNEDAGNPESSWTPVDGLMANLGVSVIRFDPDNDDAIYVGTGESYTAVNIYRESSSVGNGIWRSTDHGDTWEQLQSTTDFQYINDIEIRMEGETKVIYAAVVSGIYKGATFQSTPSDGLFRSVDNGDTWTQVLPNIPNTDTPYSPSDIEVDGIGRMFVGTMRNNDLLGAGVILHSDDGLEWTVFDEITEATFDPANQYYPGRVIIKSAPSDPNRVYAMISGGLTETKTGWIRDAGSNSIIIQSFDQGDTWTQFALPDPSLGTWSNITWHAATIAVNPTDPNDIIIGALNGFKLENADGASIVSGLDWIPTSFWNPPNGSKYVHADQHDIIYDPERPDTLFVSTDGGVFMGTNAQGDTPVFSEINKDFNTLQYYTLDISDQRGEEFLMAGTQDNNTTQLSNSEISFFPGAGGDGAYTFIDKTEPNLVIHSSQYNRFNIVFNRNVPSNTRTIANRSTGLFINPADYDSDNNLLYANRIGIDINNNENNTTPLLRVRVGNQSITETILNLGVEINSPISTIKVSPYSTSTSSNLFFGTQSGRLYRVLNGGQSPLTRERTGADFPTSSISSIDVGRSESELLVTFSNFGVNSVWYSSDAGDTWVSIEGNLPDMPIRHGIFNPLNRDQIYLATELGIWFLDRTEGDGLTWRQEQVGIGDIRVDMIKIRKSDGWFVAATHGRGIYESRINVDDFITSTPELPVLAVEAFPNPATESLRVRLNENWQGETNITLTDLQGRDFVQQKFSSSDLTVDVSTLPRGVYLLRVWSDRFKSTTKRILLR